MVLKLFVENLCMKILQRFFCVPQGGGGGNSIITILGQLVKNYNTFIWGQFWVVVASL